eukprot:633934-Prorocentrum_minimum.AAC.1
MKSASGLEEQSNILPTKSEKRVRFFSGSSAAETLVAYPLKTPDSSMIVAGAAAAPCNRGGGGGGCYEL